MRERRWIRPLARVYLIVTSAVWVTAFGFQLARSLVPTPPCDDVKGSAAALCSYQLPVWAAALVGLVGVVAAYLAARLTRPRAV